MAYPMLLTFGVGIFVRLWLFGLPVSEWLAERNEVSTPLTSWFRVTEGLALHKNGISPYSGDIFHQMPICLRFFVWMTNLWGANIHILFVLMDFLTAICMERIAKHLGRHLLLHQAVNVKNYHPDAQSLILKADQLRFVRLYAIAGVMFNPYCIVTCVAKSTAIFNNFIICMAVLFTLKASRPRAAFFIAFAAYISFYPIMLVVPAALYIAKEDSRSALETRRKEIYYASLIQTTICTGCAWLFLVYLSFIIEGSWDFIYSTYGFVLGVPDLTPNIGVFWYFFTEMFEHFRTFFLCVFQINAFIYTVPLAIRLKDHPMFLMYMLVAISAVFKSYPSYGDCSLYLAMLPLWSHALGYIRNGFVVAMMFVVSGVLAPILWHLWIYAGSANANFYFAITLVFSTAQVFLVTDILFAFLRREYELLNGTKPPIIDGKPAQVILD